MSPQKTWLSGSKTLEGVVPSISLTLRSPFHRIPRMQGGAEATLHAHATLTSTTTKQVWARPPIDVDFQVLMFTASGLIVRFLKVFEKSNYQSVKWVRYLTKASGSYQVRVSRFVLVLGDRSFWVRTDRFFWHSSESDIRACISSAISLGIYHLFCAPSIGGPRCFPEGSFSILWPPVDWNVVRTSSGVFFR